MKQTKVEETIQELYNLLEITESSYDKLMQAVEADRKGEQEENADNTTNDEDPQIHFSF